jgi:hypothetical protein
LEGVPASCAGAGGAMSKQAPIAPIAIDLNIEILLVGNAGLRCVHGRHVAG